MRFFTPRILWLFLPLWAFVPVLWYALEKRAARKFARFASVSALKVLIKGTDIADIEARRRTRFILALLAALCALIALARPQMGVREEVVPSEGLDLVFQLDVSNSMLTEDVVPSRLKKAKHVIRNFIDRLSGDRAGIVAFAGSAYPAVPLTTDYDFLKQTLDILDESSIANQGTDLSAGLEVASELVLRGGVSTDDDPAHQQSTEDQSSRVIVVLSDGESHEGDETQLVPALKEKGIRVFAIGVGSTKGGPIPQRDPNGYLKGYKKDKQGNMILSKLESANLESIASKTGGKYYTASSNEGEVEEIFNQLSTLERAPGAGRRIIVYDEMFQYPLALSVLFLLIMILLREVPGKSEVSEPQENAPLPGGATALPATTVMTLVFVLFLVPNAARAGSLSEYSDTRKGIDAYNDKDYPTAIQEFGKAQASNPESATHHINLGDALLRSGSVEGAVSEFQAAEKTKDASDAGRGAYNLGKTYEQAKDLEKAIRAYQSGLDRLAEDPKSDSEVEERIKRALEIVVQKQQQQQQQNQGGGGGGQNEQKDQKESGQQEGQDSKQQEQKGQQEKKYEIGKQKPKFKDEKLGEGDVKRVMEQMQEQEKKSQQRVMRAKTGKPKDEKETKDW